MKRKFNPGYHVYSADALWIGWDDLIRFVLRLCTHDEIKVSPSEAPVQTAEMRLSRLKETTRVDIPIYPP